MTLKQLVAFTMMASFLAVPALADKDKNKDKQRDKVIKESRVKNQGKVGDDDHDHEKNHDHNRDHDHDQVGDSQGKKKQKALPPGLQKKVQRGGELPPGWQNKVKAGEVLDPEVYARRKVLRPADKDGNEMIQVEDRVYKVYQKTRQVREIIDVLKAPTE